MKKFACVFALLLVMSISAFAEGETHDVGRSCPQGQTCCPQGQTCYTDGGNNQTLARGSKTNGFRWIDFGNVYFFLKSIL